MRLLKGEKVQEGYFIVTASPFHYMGEMFVLLVLEDVTREKSLEEKLRHNALRLEAAYQDMESFSYSVSHDLRAPLRLIDGFSHLLSKRYGDKLDEDGRDFLEHIRGECRHMSTLIDDLLQLSRITRSEMKRESVNMSALAHEIINRLSAMYPERTVDVAIRERGRLLLYPPCIRCK